MVHQSGNSLLDAAEKHVREFFKQKISPDFVFHDLPHTEKVVESVIEIGQGYQLDEQEMEILQLAAWFHDAGYDQGPDEHEERSARYARDFLTDHRYHRTHPGGRRLHYGHQGAATTGVAAGRSAL